MRILTNIIYLAHFDELFRQLNMPKMDDIYIVLRFYYNLEHDSVLLQISSFVLNLSLASRNGELKNRNFVIETIKH